MNFSEKLAAGIISLGAPLSIVATVAHLPTVLIVTAVAQVVAFALLSQTLGMQRPPVIAALVVYVLGSAATIVATGIGGYLLPAIPGSSAEAVEVAMIATRVALNATFIAFALWSIEFMHHRGAVRIGGALGLASSIGSLVMVALDTRLEPPGLLTILLTGVLWSLGAVATLVALARAGGAVLAKQW